MPHTVSEQDIALEADQVRFEHVEHLLRQTPIILVAQLVTGAVMAGLLIGRVNSVFLTAWGVGGLAILLLRMLFLISTRGQRTSMDTYRQRVIVLTLLSGTTGSLWGLLAYVVITPGDPLIALIVLMVLTGLVASAVASASSILVVFLAFILGCMLLPAWKLFAIGGSDFINIAGLMLFFIVVTTLFARGIQRTMTEAIQLRLRNEALIGKLTDEMHSAEQARQQAEKANLAKSNFLAAASHDLRQPLHALRLFATTLEIKTQDPEHRGVVANINTSVRALEELFNALLDISKLDAGTQNVHTEHVYLNGILQAIERTYTPLASDSGLELQVAPTDAVIVTDIVLLERLIANLVGNAIRYSHEGTVSLSATEAPSGWTVTVSDTGIGIASEDQQRVFDEFVQLDNPERDRSKGIGLGLSIVKRTAELLNLPLTLESEPGKGSTFQVTVPKGDAAQINPDILSQLPTSGALGNLIVLVIEDELSVRDALEGLLSEWGCTPILASDGDEAAIILDEIDVIPDVMVADFRLRSHETGTEVLKRLQQRFDRHVPGLVMTGDIATSSLLEADSSTYPVMHKPCNPAELRSFLRSVSAPDHRSD